jgi:hypothetical protein
VRTKDQPGLSFGSSVSELGLALSGVPQQVVHLTAGDECRENFSLTDITSSIGVGYELTLPGVHSDVGGGYGEREDETRELHYGAHGQLIAEGWYTAEQVHTKSEGVYSPQTGQKLYTRYTTTGVRRGLKWDYQFIPLAIMREFATKNDMSL